MTYLATIYKTRIIYTLYKLKQNQYNNSLLPSTLRDWNNLLVEAKQANKLGTFKYFLKKV